MKWITDEDLRIWSHRTDARELFVDLVGDLIRATVSDVKKFRFPGQSTGTIRGFDGHLETTEAVSRIPLGSSLWEFGTTAATSKKAQEDYGKRTSTTSAEVMAENVFIMLNLHTWDTPKHTLVQWLSKRRKEKKWRDINYIDGTELSSWLEEQPAVAAQYAKRVLGKAPQLGALSTDEFWEFYSLRFKPTLTEQMLLCGREKEAEQLLQVLSGNSQNYTVAADTSEEVIAFAVAVIRTAPDEYRKILEAKTMVVESFDAAQFMLSKKGMVFLVWKDAEQLASSLGQKGPTLTATTGIQRKQRAGIPVLNRPSASIMAEAMVSMNIDRQEGYKRAIRCGRSLTILRRLYPTANVAPAEWIGLANSLKPSLLAGGWATDSTLDKEIVASLAGGSDYVSVETPIRQTVNMSDPPFDKIGQVWQVRAPVDAFSCYGHLINENDLQWLKAAVIRVLSYQTPQPSPEEKFSFNYRAPADYSTWLRDGLAYTLMLFAIMPEVGGLELNGTTPQQYVDDIIRALPGFALNHRWIYPILPQLAAIAEAAPIPFLETLEKNLEGNVAEVLDLFKETDDFFAETSPHIYVLWALEILAWDPNLLPRVTLVLGKLAAIDPGKNSKHSNRPLSSLKEIFLSWSPNTDASLNQRFIAIDLLIQKLPDIAWNLMLLLMPKIHDTSMPTQHPKLRDTTPLQPEAITFALVWETENRLFDRIISLSEPQELRVVTLVNYFGNLQLKNQVRLIGIFENNLKKYSTSEGSILWHTLRDFIARQEAFSDSDWSVKGEVLDQLQIILRRYRPTDVISQILHLFNDSIPFTKGNINTAIDDAEAERFSELQQVYNEFGVKGLIQLAMKVKRPSQMRLALASIKLSSETATMMIFSLIKINKECYNLACIISGNMLQQEGNIWSEYFKKNIIPKCEKNKDIAWLLSTWPNNNETREFIQSLNKEIRYIYWREIATIPLNTSTEGLLKIINELRKVGRSLSILTSINNRVKDLSSEMLLSLLDESVDEIVNGTVDSTMLTYSINEFFTTLATRSDVTHKEVAQREYIYLPLIQNSVKGLSIHALLAEEPSEYISVIKDAFISDTDIPDPAPSKEKKIRATMAYRLLKSFHTIPGDNDGVIDELILNTWITKVRQLASECGRSNIVDEFIGQLLAHAGIEKNKETWPPLAIASILEKISSDILERGMEIERTNMRGAYSKSFHEGGIQERELASRYHQWAAQTTSFRTTSMLERIAKGWDEMAKREDIRAELRKIKH